MAKAKQAASQQDAAHDIISADSAVTPPDNASTVARKRIAVTPAQIAMAQLHITLDRRLGRVTPEVIKKIAAAK